MEDELYYVEIIKKENVTDIGPLNKPTIVSEKSLVMLVRETALFADLICRQAQNQKNLSHKLERLKQIKKVLTDQKVILK